MLYARLITLAVLSALGFLTYSAFCMEWMSFVMFPKFVGVSLMSLMFTAGLTLLALFGLEEQNGFLVVKRGTRLSSFCTLVTPNMQEPHACDIFIRLVPIVISSGICLFGVGSLIYGLFTDPAVIVTCLGAAAVCMLLFAAGVTLFLQIKNAKLQDKILVFVFGCVLLCMGYLFIYSPIEFMSEQSGGSFANGVLQYALHLALAFGAIVLCIFGRKGLKRLPSLYGRICLPVKK